ncbi:hypothetical protein WA158_001193 [Blastocystis sp. Blastoise]
MGKRVAGKAKPKSFKTRAINLSSKRKLARMGKKQKQGHSGTAAAYITRTQAIRRLQITLKDFRRLCIIKGIYPRDPKKKLKSNKSTYYHVKDISFLANEPLLNQFRQFKTFMKKIRNSYGRGEISEARRRYDNLPEMSLDHIIKERYPTFIDAIRDLDDPLSMVHLFARLPAQGKIRTNVTYNSLRLSKEWQLWVTKTKCLRKVFISIKGIYYQAEYMGEKITWLVPHQFSQDLPNDVDYKVMLTFLEFYEVLLRFVLFKLYNDAGLVYPPEINIKKEEEGGYLNTLKVETITKSEGTVVEEAAVLTDTPVATTNKDKEENTSDNEEEKDSEGEDEGKTKEQLEKESAERIAKIEESMKYLTEPTAPTTAPATTEDDFTVDTTFADNEEAKALIKKEKEIKRFTNLFGGLVFFICREVPRESVEFIVRCFGGEVGWQGEGSPYSYSDSRITHVIMDRPNIINKIDNREYLQPQWVYDSINNEMLLPSTRYLPGTKLPPHLSPFVDPEEEGYMPEYAKELLALKNPELANPVTEETLDEIEDREEAFTRELEMERTGKKEEDKEEEEEKKATAQKRKVEQLEEDQREKSHMSKIMMPKRIKKLYNKMEYGKKTQQKKAKKLEQKAKERKEE